VGSPVPVVRRLALALGLLLAAAPAAAQEARSALDPWRDPRLRVEPHAAAALSGDWAPAAGALAGAGAGLLIATAYCRARPCEMGEVIGLLGGAVVGYALVRAARGERPPVRR
jgi:hypothetical protein